jgi:hypothetical protein
MRTLLCTSLTVSLACGFDAAFERATDHDDQFASLGDVASGLAGASGEPEEPGGSEAVETVTGSTEGGNGADDTGASSTTTAAPNEDAKPVILSWTASKLQVWEVGPVELAAVVSDEVTAVDVYQGNELVTTLQPPDLTYTWAVLGELQDGAHTWSAVARTPSTESAPAQLVVDVDVPAGGLPQWYEPAGDADLSLAAAVATVDDVSIVVGYRKGVVGALTLRRYEGESIVWTRSVTQWSKYKEAQDHTTGVDVAIDGEGNIIVAGNVLAGPRRYVAKLDPTGTLLWEHLGAVGELAHGVAVDDEGRVYLAGAAPVEADTRLKVWSWNSAGLKPWPDAGYEDKLDVLHLQSERATAVTRVGDRVIVVGEVEVMGDFNEIVPRTIVLQLTPGGEVKTADTWISVGDWGGRDGARDVITVGDEYCLTGWSGTPPRALTRCSDGLQPWWSTPHQVDTVALSITHNQRLEVVVAGQRLLAKDTPQVWVEALVPGGDVVAWTFNGGPGQANGVDCGRWGPCVYVGVSAFQWIAGALTP